MPLRASLARLLRDRFSRPVSSLMSSNAALISRNLRHRVVRRHPGPHMSARVSSLTPASRSPIPTVCRRSWTCRSAMPALRRAVCQAVSCSSPRLARTAWPVPCRSSSRARAARRTRTRRAARGLVHDGLGHRVADQVALRSAALDVQPGNPEHGALHVSQVPPGSPMLVPRDGPRCPRGMYRCGESSAAAEQWAHDAEAGASQLPLGRNQPERAGDAPSALLESHGQRRSIRVVRGRRPEVDARSEH